jgi:hypothetical protein
MKRHPKSRSRGRPGAPAEVVLRLLILKHIRNANSEPRFCRRKTECFQHDFVLQLRSRTRVMDSENGSCAKKRTSSSTIDWQRSDNERRLCFPSYDYRRSR